MCDFAGVDCRGTTLQKVHSLQTKVDMLKRIFRLAKRDLKPHADVEESEAVWEECQERWKMYRVGLENLMARLHCPEPSPNVQGTVQDTVQVAESQPDEQEEDDMNGDTADEEASSATLEEQDITPTMNKHEQKRTLDASDDQPAREGTNKRQRRMETDLAIEVYNLLSAELKKVERPTDEIITRWSSEIVAVVLRKVIPGSIAASSEPGRTFLASAVNLAKLSSSQP